MGEKNENPKEILEEKPIAKKKKRGFLRFFVFTFSVVVLAVLGVLFFKTGSTFSEVFVRNIKNDISGGKLPEEPGFEAYKEDGRINILLLGARGPEDPGDGKLLADTIMLVSIKKSEDKAAIISIPRDLYVELPDGKGKNKINFSYALGEQAHWGGGGLVYSKEIVSRITGLHVDYAASIDFKGFEKAINQLGGVTVKLDKDFVERVQWSAEGKEGSKYWVPTENGWEFRVPAGENKLNGEESLYFVRSRYSTSDFDRMKRQHEVLVALKDKALSLGILANPVKVFNLLDTLGKSVKTDMDLSDIKEMMEVAKNMKNTNVKHRLFDTSAEGLLYSTKINGMYVLLPVGDNYEKIREVCKNIFNQ